MFARIALTSRGATSSPQKSGIRSLGSVSAREYFHVHQSKHDNGFSNRRGFGSSPGTNPPSNNHAEEQLRKQKLQKLLSEYQKSKDRKIFEDQLDFPTAFVMKIIDTNDASFLSDMLSLVATSVKVDPSSIPHSVRTSGPYLSITVKPTFADASQLYSTYDVIGKDHRVKFIL